MLYRDDGTTLTPRPPRSTSSRAPPPAPRWCMSEGPFGTLDAQGFAITDRGAVIQFSGPGRLVLNSAQGHPAPAPPPGGAEAPPPRPPLALPR